MAESIDYLDYATRKLLGQLRMPQFIDAGDIEAIGNAIREAYMLGAEERQHDDTSVVPLLRDIAGALLKRNGDEAFLLYTDMPKQGWLRWRHEREGVRVTWSIDAAGWA